MQRAGDEGTPRTTAPSRRVFEHEALAWLAETPAPEGASVVTSLPDRSEIPGLGFDEWRAWFVRAARDVVRWVGLQRAEGRRARPPSVTPLPPGRRIRAEPPTR